MTSRYGYVKAKLNSSPFMKASKLPHEIQYHLHVGASIEGTDWDFAVNVGTSQENDLLKYKLIPDFRHDLTKALAAVGPGDHDLTGSITLPALDFQRGADIFDNTFDWKDSDVMDGSDTTQPAAAIKELMIQARDAQWDVYFFGRFYTGGDNGIHDIHMNQGSSGRFLNPKDPDAALDPHPSSDYNDIWQDGAMLIDTGNGWKAYFSAFTQQTVPTNDFGNPIKGGHPI